ncbi:MAG: hypothetical protein ACXWRA_08255 [Pseudobdellovibrionaceae bacterium]
METTDKKIEANRINGQKGGVKTEAGKAISSQNAVKHGIFSKITTSYDEKSYEELYKEFADEFGTETPLRRTLVEHLAITLVRINRCIRFENESLRQALNPPEFKEVVVRKPKGLLPIDDYDPGEVRRELIKGEAATLPDDFYDNLEGVVLKYEPALWTRLTKLLEMLAR